MSGGHFNYEQYKLKDIADKIDEDVLFASRHKKDEYGYDPYLPPEVRREMRKLEKMLRKMYAIVHDYDWWFSGDSDKESFMRRMKKLK